MIVINEDNPVLLIINDTDLTIEYIQEVYADTQYTLHVATNGKDGLKMAHELDPDVILLDIQMPGIDGFEVCRQLRASKETADIPILFTTAHARDSQNLSKALDLGGDDFITEPFDILELKARVRVLLRLKQYSDNLKKQIYIDTLTNLNNRRFFHERIKSLYYDSILFSSTLTFVMCDLDHFKKINDKYGHGVGDEVLRHFADILHANTRHQDLVVRYGGEEFILVFVKTELNAVLDIIENIRMQTESSELMLDGDFVHFTASFGVTYYSGKEEKILSINNLIETADQAMYKAKQEGRNRMAVIDLYKK